MSRRSRIFNWKSGVGAVLTLIIAGLLFFAGKRNAMIPMKQTGPRVTNLPHKENLHFFALGDTGTGDAHQMAVAQAMEVKCQSVGGIDGLLLLGDNFYKVGVNGTDDPQWQSKMEIPYSLPCLKKATIYPIFGNHDYRGNTDAQIEYHRINPRWYMPSRFYSVRFGTLFNLIALDTGFPDFCLMPGHCSVDFLREQLKNKDEIRWNVVLAHHPLSSASQHGFTHSGGFLGFVLRQFACGKADGWLAGHAHHMEHRMKNGCDTQIFVSGGGGADLYKINEEEESKFASSNHGFLSLQVSGEALTYEFVNLSSETVYQFINKK